MPIRKTLDVVKFTAQINEVLSQSTCEPGIRQGMMTALETVLHQTGNYQGFRYLVENEVPSGHAPGINISPVDGQYLENFEARFANTDRTRVSYYV